MVLLFLLEILENCTRESTSGRDHERSPQKTSTRWHDTGGALTSRDTLRRWSEPRRTAAASHPISSSSNAPLSPLLSCQSALRSFRADAADRIYVGVAVAAVPVPRQLRHPPLPPAARARRRAGAGAASLPVADQRSACGSWWRRRKLLSIGQLSGGFPQLSSAPHGQLSGGFPQHRSPGFRHQPVKTMASSRHEQHCLHKNQPVNGMLSHQRSKAITRIDLNINSKGNKAAKGCGANHVLRFTSGFGSCFCSTATALPALLFDGIRMQDSDEQCHHIQPTDQRAGERKS